MISAVLFPPKSSKNLEKVLLFFILQFGTYDAGTVAFEATEGFFFKNDVMASNQCAISTVRYSGDLMCTFEITKAKFNNLHLSESFNC